MSRDSNQPWLRLSTRVAQENKTSVCTHLCAFVPMSKCHHLNTSAVTCKNEGRHWGCCQQLLHSPPHWTMLETPGHGTLFQRLNVSFWVLTGKRGALLTLFLISHRHRTEPPCWILSCHRFHFPLPKQLCVTTVKQGQEPECSHAGEQKPEEGGELLLTGGCSWVLPSSFPECQPAPPTPLPTNHRTLVSVMGSLQSYNGIKS